MTVTTPFIPSTVSKETARLLMNEYGQQREAFFFIFDFELQKPIVLSGIALKNAAVQFDINGKRNFRASNISAKKVCLQKKPISKAIYQKAFEKVQTEINQGNSYLLNLTFPTEIQINQRLSSIFLQSHAKYKLLLQPNLLVFSPETFVKIQNGKIASFPMKGTIDASLPNAAAIIMADKKEKAEHATIVDLIRNDLNRVATKVRVERFRYLEQINSSHKNLLQVSSKITGVLPNAYQDKMGDILMQLLPAGSISGAPKKKTVEIIKDVEGQERGYYTGVFGYFDGNNLDSGVMIRYIEKIGNRFFYKSGGGITAFSDCEKEYQELLDKVYVPIY